MKDSDYVRRDYRTLHLKSETHHRLMLVKAQMQARDKQFITQDKFINALLDSYGESCQPEPMAEAEFA